MEHYERELPELVQGSYLYHIQGMFTTIYFGTEHGWSWRGTMSTQSYRLIRFEQVGVA